VKRLSFIVEGEMGIYNLNGAEKCPLCEGEIPSQDYLSCIETSQLELKRITSQIESLGEAEQDTALFEFPQNQLNGNLQSHMICGV